MDQHDAHKGFLDRHNRLMTARHPMDRDAVLQVVPVCELSRRQSRQVLDGASRRLAATHRALISTDMMVSGCWDEVAARLARRGLMLTDDDGAMVLSMTACGSRVGTAAELRLPEAALCQRLGPCPFGRRQKKSA